MSLVGSAVYALIVFVLFGWFEQTLRMLADIAANTGLRVATQMPAYGAAPPPPPSGS